MNNQAPDKMSRKSAISTGRFVAGVFVHCLLPTYLVALAFTFIAAGPATTGTSLAERLLSWSGWFLAVYAGLTIVSVAGAALFDPLARRYRARRVDRDPRVADAASRRRVAAAVSAGRRLLDERSRTMLEAIRVTPWDHADPRYQTLSVELAEVVRTSSAAIASAPPDRRPDLHAVAGQSLGHLATALSALGEARARLDEGDARVMARYVRLRHAQSDFTSDRS